MNRILDEMKNKTFSREVTYHTLPVLVFEKELLYFKDNPYLPNHQAPISICIMTDHFEAWIESAKKPIINNDKEIKKLLKESKAYIKDNRKGLETTTSNITAKNILEKINDLNQINGDLYKLYAFFINESFETEDEELLEELPQTRLEMSKFAQIIWDGLEKCLEIISKKSGVKRSSIDRMTTNELRSLVKTRIYEDCSERQISIITKDNQAHILFGGEVTELAAILKQSRLKGQMRGSIASSGKANGRVLKVTAEQYKKLHEILDGKKDYILVTPMTRPEITPFIKNAKGIITDEGGITCHAAIIAREFKIPCIVGTKNATKLLQDNDLVELDAVKNKITKLR